MSDSRDGTGAGLSLGVLIIGSLYWDPADHRRKWRGDCLDLNGERYVDAPIRYGRRSRSRGCSYTMVFSSSLAPRQYGRAIAVPCGRARNTAELVDAAVRLWTAETSDGKNRQRRVSASWGCVALLENPRRPMPADVRAGWTKRVSGEACYGRLNSAVDEVVAVNESGFLQIPWPGEDGSDLGVDVLLATATNPTIVEGRYPTAQQVADAWNSRDGREYVDYFFKNKERGIRTFEDNAIEERLGTRSIAHKDVGLGETDAKVSTPDPDRSEAGLQRAVESRQE